MQFGNLHQRLSLHGRYLSKALRCTPVDVVRLSLRRQDARVDAEEGDSAGEWIRKSFEDKCGKRLVVRNFAFNFRAMTVLSGDGPSRHRIGHIADNRVEQLRYSNVGSRG